MPRRTAGKLRRCLRSEFTLEQPAMLFIKDLTYRIAGRTLLDKASLSIPAGYRVGLVGPNGTGKSTLFKLIAGELQSDGGDITLIRGANMGMVRQDMPDD